MKGLIVLFLTLIACSSFAQQQEDQLHGSIVVKMNGYLIDLGDDNYYFQPCDSMKVFPEFLNTFSFRLGTQNSSSDNLLLDFTRGLSDTFSVRLKWRAEDSVFDEAPMQYFFCEVKLQLLAFLPTNFVVNDRAPITIDYYGKLYYMECLWMRNRVLKVRPYATKQQEKLLQNFKDNGYEPPAWMIQMGKSKWKDAL